VCLDFFFPYFLINSENLRVLLSIPEAADMGIKDEDGDKTKGIFSPGLVSEMVKPR
jgi:hypothetical protein